MEQHTERPEINEDILVGTGVAIWTVDYRTDRNAFAGAWSALIGCAPETIDTGLSTFRDLIHPDDRPAFLAEVGRCRDGKQGGYTVEFRLRHADGRDIWVEDRCVVLERDAAGAAVRMAGHTIKIARRMAAEAEARVANQRLRDAVEMLPDGFVMFDADDRVILANHRIREIFGIGEDDDITGKTYPEVLEFAIDHGCFPRATTSKKGWARAFLDERAAAGEVFLREERLANGRWVRIVDRRLPSGGWIGLRIDITTPKAQAKRLEAILEGAGHPTWEYDIVQDRLSLSPGWYQTLGLDPEDFDGALNSLARFTDPRDMARMRAAIAEHAAGHTPRFGVTLHHQTPRKGDVWMQIHGRITEHGANGAPLRAAGVGIDVTAEHQLRARLEEAVLIAERASRARLDLMARMSHEIRTPLNGVLGVISLLQASLTDPDQRHLLTVAEQSGEHLISLIDEILNLSRIDTGRLTLDSAPFVPRDLADRVRAAHEIIASRKGIELSVLCDTHADRPRLGDRNRLLEILHNLVGNAVKFTDSGGVEVRLRSNPAGPLEITVRDSGPGMTEDEAARLFEPFVQARADVAGRYGGSGLGLSIVKKLVELMGGTVTLDTAPGRGSVMRVSLPLPVVTD